MKYLYVVFLLIVAKVYAEDGSERDLKNKANLTRNHIDEQGTDLRSTYREAPKANKEQSGQKKNIDKFIEDNQLKNYSDTISEDGGGPWPLEKNKIP